MTHTLPATPRRTNFHFPFPESVLTAWVKLRLAAAGWITGRHRRRRARATFLALNALDDATRKDIGLTEAEFERIQLRAFHGNPSPGLDGRP